MRLGHNGEFVAKFIGRVHFPRLESTLLLKTGGASQVTWSARIALGYLYSVLL